MEAPWHAVGPLSGIPEGRLFEAVAGGEMVLLVRKGTTVHAMSPLCPHKFGHLGDGFLDSTHLTCPQHTAAFDLVTGKPMPGQEWAGVLPIYPTRVVKGILEVQVAPG